MTRHSFEQKEREIDSQKKQRTKKKRVERFHDIRQKVFEEITTYVRKYEDSKTKCWFWSKG